MNTVLAVDLIKGRPCAWPRLESDTHIMTAGSARPLEDAFRIAQLDLVQWLGADYGLDPLDAYQLVTQAVESPLANVCDPNYTSVAKMAKQYLPPAARDGRRARPAQRARRHLPGRLSGSRAADRGRRWWRAARRCGVLPTGEAAARWPAAQWPVGPVKRAVGGGAGRAVGARERRPGITRARWRPGTSGGGRMPR